MAITSSADLTRSGARWAAAMATLNATDDGGTSAAHMAFSRGGVACDTAGGALIQQLGLGARWAAAMATLNATDDGGTSAAHMAFSRGEVA